MEEPQAVEPDTSFEVDGITYVRPRTDAHDRSVYVRTMFQLIDESVASVAGDGPGYIHLRYEESKLPWHACLTCWVQNKPWWSHEPSMVPVPDHELESIGDSNERPL